MSGLIQVIKFIVANWAAVYSIIKAIMELIHRMQADSSQDSKALVKEHTKDLADAVTELKKSGDKKPLERLLCKIRGNCEI